jgi:hypothetical protein
MPNFHWGGENSSEGSSEGAKPSAERRHDDISAKAQNIRVLAFFTL